MRPEAAMAVDSTMCEAWFARPHDRPKGDALHGRAARAARRCKATEAEPSPRGPRLRKGQTRPPRRCEGPGGLPMRRQARPASCLPGAPRRASESRPCGPKMHGKPGAAVSEGLVDKHGETSQPRDHRTTKYHGTMHSLSRPSALSSVHASGKHEAFTHGTHASVGSMLECMAHRHRCMTNLMHISLSCQSVDIEKSISKQRV